MSNHFDVSNEKRKMKACTQHYSETKKILKRKENEYCIFFISKLGLLHISFSLFLGLLTKYGFTCVSLRSL